MKITPQAFYKLLDTPSRTPRITVRGLRILAFIYIENKPTNLHGIAAILGLPPPALSRALDRLCTFGLLRRVRNEHDRRIILIRITDGGRAYIKDICA